MSTEGLVLLDISVYDKLESSWFLNMLTNFFKPNLKATIYVRNWDKFGKIKH